MVSTIKEALKHGMEIRREVRFYAVREDGVHYALNHDWTLEQLDRKLLENTGENDE